MSLGTEALTCWNLFLFLEDASLKNWCLGHLMEFSLMPAIDVEDFVFVLGLY